MRKQQKTDDCKRFSGVLIMFLVLTLAVIPLISAIPKTQSTTIISMGIEVESPIFESHKQNQPFYFHVHAHNATDGRILKNDTTFCILHLYNPEDGEHLVKENMTFPDSEQYDFELKIEAGNFSRLGSYAILFYCEVDGEIGGFFEHGFVVTPTGIDLTVENAIIYIGLLGLFVFIFLCTVISIPFLPSSDARSEEGELLSVSSLKHLRLVFYGLAYILLMTIMFLASNIALAFLFDSLIGDVLFKIFNLMSWLLFPLLIILFLWIFYSIFRDKETKRMLERGVDMGEI